MMNYPFEPANVIACDLGAAVRELTDAVSAPDLQLHLAAMTGLDAAQLEDVSKIDAKQLMSLCAAVSFLSHRTGREELAAAGKRADTLLNAWMNGCYKAVDRRVHFMRSLVNAGEKEDVLSFLAEFRLFLDASILCSAGMPDFLDRLLPELAKLEQAPRITVPLCVITCLKELDADPVSRELTGARSGLEQLKRLHDAGCLSVRGDESDSTIMSTFISAFSRFKPTNSLVLLTEDPVLASAVEKLNAIGIEGRDVLIAGLCEDGVARIWGETEDEEDTEVTAVGEVPAGEHEELAVMEAPAEELSDDRMPEPISEDVPAEDAGSDTDAYAQDQVCVIDLGEPTVIYTPDTAGETSGIHEHPEAETEELPLESFLIPVPMDTPLDGITAPASAEREQAYEVEDDDGDDVVTDESDLEAYLRISSLLRVDEDDDDDEEDQVLYMEPLDDDDDDEEIVFTDSDYKLDFDGILFSDSLIEPAETEVWKPDEAPAKPVPEEPARPEETIRIGMLAGEEDSLDPTKRLPADPNLDWESLE